MPSSSIAAVLASISTARPTVVTLQSLKLAFDLSNV